MPAKRAKRSDCNYVLYVLTCTVTGDRYLGLTRPKGRAFRGAVKVRWQKHVSRAKMEGKKTAEWGLYQSIRENGAENFTFAILEIVRGKEAAFKRESEVINSGEFTLNTHKRKVSN